MVYDTYRWSAIFTKRSAAISESPLPPRYLHLNRDRTLIIPELRRVKNAGCTVDLIAAGHLHTPNCITRASSSLAVPR